MKDDQQLEELLDAWQESLEAGEPVTPEALCKDCMHLLPDLARRVAVLLRFEALRRAGDREV